MSDACVYIRTKGILFNENIFKLQYINKLEPGAQESQIGKVQHVFNFNADLVELCNWYVLYIGCPSVWLVQFIVT